MLSGNNQLDKKINQIIHSLWDFLFPINCIGCRTEGIWLCQSCINKVKLSQEQICPVCKRISRYGNIHKSCQQNSFLDGVVAATLYQDKIIRQAIHNYKYQGAKDISKVLSRLVIENARNNPNKIFRNVDIVVSVPLHRKRFVQRGFNQTNLIAQDLCNYFEWQYSDSLRRVKFTQTQTKFNESQRKSNISGVFELTEGTDVKNKNFIIVDDVITTGSTLQECAKMLKKAGANQVWGLAVAQD